MRFQIGVSLFWFFFTANIDGRCRHLFIDAASSAARHLTHGRLGKVDMWTSEHWMSVTSPLFSPDAYLRRYSSASLSTGVQLASSLWHAANEKPDNVDTWTIVNIGKFQLFLWPSLANRLSPQTFCARKAAATDRRTRFWPLTHTEIFSPWFRSNFGLGFLFWRQKSLLLLPSIVRREQFSVLRSRESRDCLFWPGVRFLPV